MAIQIQFRRGTAAEWTSGNPILAEGEMGNETDTGKFKVGDGVRTWNILPYSSGPQGIQGPVGPQGIQGIQGIQGEQGEQGETGPQGVTGDTGAQGIQGIQGIQGETGDTGPQGVQGIKGDTGDQGPQGLQGIQGIQGETGEQGPQGIQGIQGEIGDTGPQGIQGIQGIQGETGETGPQGIQGETGPQGIQGIQGIQGETGEGVIAGGAAGQILAKASATDFDTTWIDNVVPQVKHIVKNSTGSVIPAGSVVYVSGANGTNMLVSLADADSEATSSKTMGLTETSIAVNGTGYVVTEGLLAGLNTNAATAGQSVWLSSTAGGFVFGAPPAKPAHGVYLGVVTRVQTNNGEIFVKVQNGYELEELHNVSITSPVDKQVIKYDGASQLWINGVAGGGVTTGSSAPATPSAGDAWFDTNDGLLYVWYVDANSSQWVEVKANSALDAALQTRVATVESRATALETADATTNRAAFVPVVPSSVSVGSGTATTNSSGVVTFTSATNITLNGIFTSAYKHYQVVLDVSNATAQEVFGWFTNAGSPIATSWYGAGYVAYYTGTTGVVNARNNGTNGWVTHAGPYYSEASLHVFIDTINNRCQYDFTTFAKGIGAWVAGGYGTDGVTDGFRISAASGAATGTIRIYGMR